MISESKRIANLELWAPNIGTVKVIKKKKSTKKKKNTKSKKSKSKKSKTKSPARDSRSTNRAKKRARKITKKR